MATWFWFCSSIFWILRAYNREINLETLCSRFLHVFRTTITVIHVDTYYFRDLVFFFFFFKFAIALGEKRFGKLWKRTIAYNIYIAYNITIAYIINSFSSFEFFLDPKNGKSFLLLFCHYVRFNSSNNSYWANHIFFLLQLMINYTLN